MEDHLDTIRSMHAAALREDRHAAAAELASAVKAIVRCRYLEERLKRDMETRRKAAENKQ